MMPRLAFSLVLALSHAPPHGGAMHSAPPRWIEVFRNSDYGVMVDTVNVGRRRDGTYVVQYETWHLHGEVDEGRRFNREVIRSELRCAPIGFRTIEVTLFLDHGPALSRRPGDGAAPGSPWRVPGATSVDLAAMRATCRILRARTRETS
jgi:hypothetical protein